MFCLKWVYNYKKSKIIKTIITLNTINSVMKYK